MNEFYDLEAIICREAFFGEGYGSVGGEEASKVDDIISRRRRRRLDPTDSEDAVALRLDAGGQTDLLGDGFMPRRCSSLFFYADTGWISSTAERWGSSQRIRCWRGFRRFFILYRASKTCSVNVNQTIVKCADSGKLMSLALRSMNPWLNWLRIDWRLLMLPRKLANYSN